VKNKTDIVINDDLIVRYLSGEALPEEAEALHDWMVEGNNMDYFKQIEATWNAALPSGAQLPINKENAWRNVHANIKSGPASSPFGFWLKIAATLIVGISAGLFVYYRNQDRTLPAELVVASKTTQETITLPDNSTVVLNRNSSVSYTEDFGGSQREVNFSGEGFFRVEGDAAKPFVIHTTLANIKVVGTVFNVSTQNNKLEVGVQEGKVLVYTATDSSLLEAGYSATLEAGRPIQPTNRIDINSWGYATRKFVFQDTPLADVFQSIERAYPYSIEVPNEDIKNCRLTAAFDKVSAREMLNLIGETLDLTVQENDSTFRIEGKGCPLAH